jgi:excinuclease ABC subunit A
MFIGGMKEEAELDEIIGLSPTISIDQKTTNKNPRSTVGTITEIYDYYKLLFLNIGERKCLHCGTLIKKDSLNKVVADISAYDKGKRFMVLSPLYKEYIGLSFEKLKKDILDKGFIRFLLEGKVYTINDEVKINDKKAVSVDVIVDRLITENFLESG